MLLNEPGTQTGLTDVFIGGSFWNGTRQRVSQELQLLIRPRKAPYYLLISEGRKKGKQHYGSGYFSNTAEFICHLLSGFKSPESKML